MREGRHAIDFAINAGVAEKALDVAKALAQKFGIDANDGKPRWKSKLVTVADYAEFCALPESFLRETFELANTAVGVKIPYKNESGAVVSVQRRHRLEKGEKKDQRFTWRKGDKPIPYGVWLLPDDRKRLVIVEGGSDVHVLHYSGILALGIPGAGNFKPEMTEALLPFAELLIVQEPGAAGEHFVSSITTALKHAEYNGIVRAVSLPEKDPRALWLKITHKSQFIVEIEQAITSAPPIELSPVMPLTKDLLDELSTLIGRFIFFKNKRVALLIAIWILATYVHDRFEYFPVLWITSVVMRSGKSRLVDLLDHLVWRSTGPIINTSLAALYCTTAEGCTFLADEVENLKNSDREQFGAIMGIINAGFAKGATVRRMVQVDGGWVQKKFPVYGPKVLSGISTVADTIRDRSLPVKMVRKRRDERVPRLNMRRESKTLNELRGKMALWADENCELSQKIYDDLPDEPALQSCDDRFLDIVEPLLAIVKLADAESPGNGKRVIDEIMPLLQELGGQRSETQCDEAIVALLGILEFFSGAEEKCFIPSAYLLEKTKGTPALQWIGSFKALANFMSKLDLGSGHSEDRSIRGYKITKEIMDDLKSRYMPDRSEIDPSEPSESRAQSGSRFHDASKISAWTH